MPRNVEIKAQVNNPVELRARVEELCDTRGELIRQEDIFFDVPAGRLKLRILREDRAELIYYQRPDAGGPSLSHYQIHPVVAPDSLKELLAKALGVRGVVRKRRWLFWVGDTRIHLDQVDGLGDYLELEVVLKEDQTVAEGETIAADLMSKLNIQAKDLVEGAYIDLLEAGSGAAP